CCDLRRSASVLPLLFGCMRRCLPKSTLFPYTTLFRSAVDEVGRATSDLGRTVGGSRCGHVVRRVGAGRDRAEQQIPPGLGQRAIDRKSTRLNSSHVKISYAVFCLKNK